MAREPFSKRYGLRTESNHLIYDSVSVRVREDLFALVDEQIVRWGLNKRNVHRGLLSCAPSLREKSAVGWTSSWDEARARIFRVITQC